MDTDQEEEAGKVYSLEGFAGEIIEHLIKDGKLLTRVELYIACSSEKLLNLNGLMMNVAMKEGDFKDFASENEDLSGDSIEKGLEFDLVSRILYSEVRELQKFMAGLQTETVHVRELISACKNLGESFLLMEEKLLGSEESLKQLQEQVSGIGTQSATFRKTLSCFDGGENRNGDKGADGDFLDEEQLLNTDKRIKMQTAEQQRDALLMLEKSLSREMDLEKKLTEIRQVEEELKQKLLSCENELCRREGEACNVWEKLFEADNFSKILIGISKELLARLHILQFNLNGSLKREDELKSKLESANKQLTFQEITLKRFESGERTLNDFFVAQAESLKSSLSETEEKIIIVSSEAFSLREKVSSLEKQLKCSEFQRLNAKASYEESPKEDNDVFQISELENVIEDLKEKLSKAENRAESAEAKCKLLAETNMELNDEVGLLNVNENTYEKVESLERKLQESDIQHQHAMASLEANLEKQSMLNSTIGDTENLVEDLKLKVSEAENRADNSEGKCIILSESHADLNGKVDSLERQLRESDIQLQHTVASLEASLEKQSMLYSTIGDMENLIEDLKLKNSKAESRADNAEDKCIILSESHADLNEELNFLRGRMGCLEAALHQSEGTKSATAKDIGIRTKVITNLVVQLAIERERLHKQISSLAKENKILVRKLQQKNENPSAYMSQDGKENGKDSMFCECDQTPCTKEGEGQVTDVPTTSYEISTTRENISEIETIRRIDARVLNIKHVSIAILVLLISAAAYLFQQPNCPF